MSVQLKINPEPGEEINAAEPTTHHPFFFRTTPPKRNSRYTMTQTGQQSIISIVAKPHIHVMLTQMSIKEGIKNLVTRATMCCLRNSTDYMNIMHYCLKERRT